MLSLQCTAMHVRHAADSPRFHPPADQGFVKCSTPPPAGCPTYKGFTLKRNVYSPKGDFGQLQEPLDAVANECSTGCKAFTTSGARRAVHMYVTYPGTLLCSLPASSSRPERNNNAPVLAGWLKSQVWPEQTWNKWTGSGPCDGMYVRDGITYDGEPRTKVKMAAAASCCVQPPNRISAYLPLPLPNSPTLRS